MPQVQIPDFEGQNQERERGYQNAMLNKSRLKSAGIEQGEQQRAISKRNELEQLMLRTPEPDRDRAAFEWSKVNDLNLHGKLQALQLEKLQQTIGVNPPGALANFERATGEKLDYDPAAGMVRIPTEDGFIAVTPKSIQPIKIQKPLDVRAQESQALSEAAARGQAAGYEGQRAEAAALEEKKRLQSQEFTAGENEKNRQARLKATGMRAASGAAGTGTKPSVDLTDEGLTLAATQYAKTGELPALGMGGSAGLRQKIINRAAQLFPGLDIATNKANFIAGNRNQKLIRSLDAVDAGLKTVLETSKEFSRSEVGILNDIILKGNIQVNNPKAIRFQTAIQAVIDDLASALSGGGATTDQARNQAKLIFNNAYSAGGLEAAVGSVREVMDARRAAFAAGTPYEKKGGPAPETGVGRIIQRNKTTGAYRHSDDGGKTWQPGQ